MSSTPSSKKGPAASTRKKVDGAVDQTGDYLSQLKNETKQAASNDWDYKLALAVITLLAFATRFYAITHPNQVVFDEVHFGKVRLSKPSIIMHQWLT
jgi:dolichyl-phosphate-mannose-protein mannosyltransferase